MDFYIFINVNNPKTLKDQKWDTKQRNAIYRAFSTFEKKKANHPTINIKQFIHNECIGPSFSIIFEYHRSDEQSIDEMITSANTLMEYLETECKGVGLVVSMSSSV